MPKTKVVVGIPKLGARERRQIEQLKNLPDSAIDYSDIPPQSSRGWRRANPATPQLALRLDADVMDWIESLGKRARTRVNSILRAAMKAG